MRAFFVSMLSAVTVASCATSSQSLEMTVERAPPRGCAVTSHHPTLSAQPSASIVACERRPALIEPTAEALRAARVRAHLVGVRGPRAWREIQDQIDASGQLLRICHQRWGNPDLEDSLSVVAVIRANGIVGAVRAERADALGRCVANVVRSARFTPQGFSSEPTDVLVRVSFWPSPWTLWASN